MGHSPHNENKSPSRHQRNSSSHSPHPLVSKRPDHLDLKNDSVHQHGRASQIFLTVPRSLGSHNSTHKRTRSKGQAEAVASLLERGIKVDPQAPYSAVRKGILSENCVWDYIFLTGEERQQLSKSLIGKQFQLQSLNTTLPSQSV